MPRPKTENIYTSLCPPFTMSLSSKELVLPRPGQASGAKKQPVTGPPEPAFTNTFGTLLPPANYLQTTNGKAAYYDLPPSVFDAGSAIPERVLLIHGVQTPALGLLPLARALQAPFPKTHFVLFDHWGHGLSDTPIAPHEPSLFHGLIDALLDQLDWPTVHLIGYSFGGALSPAYVVSRSTRVQSFTLIAPAGLMQLSWLNAEEQGHVRGGGDETAARKWVHRWLEGGELVVPNDWEERVEKGQVVAPALRGWQLREHGGHSASVLGIIRDGGIFDNHDTFAKAALTGIPSLAVLGELDDIVSPEALKDVGITNVVVVPEAGHGVVRESVPEVAAVITGFWKQLK
ncbi:uncharacterized protein N0V89_001098 [Didymosphaeria variabile]|uniref:AB hydrolase-1 domain-containing protein n=1 Tax=Didymosphaeria variabile TaxID=1932322 RepID=A0A9W8XWH3_9PLEO|nr:uncharacterized protein N0V89_001098 [Didymosphaeria variabile]KAJ4360533.1 hypothetical protein N0V89_001098 [Didymosphaeria variabile]